MGEVIVLIVVISRKQFVRSYQLPPYALTLDGPHLRLMASVDSLYSTAQTHTPVGKSNWWMQEK